MKYLLDTNIIIAITSYRDEAVLRRAAACDEGDIVTSAIAYAEVALGTVRNRPPAIEALHAFAGQVAVLPFDASAAEAYATLPFRRRSYDRLIAAHALAAGLVLVTDNVADFVDVEGLTVENWRERGEAS